MVTPQGGFGFTAEIFSISLTTHQFPDSLIGQRMVLVSVTKQQNAHNYPDITIQT